MSEQERSSQVAGRVLDLTVLHEPTRRAIVGLLAARPRRATGLALALDVSIASMSRHLRILRANGIVRDSRVARDGRARLYTIEPLAARRVTAWLAASEPLTPEPVEPATIRVRRTHAGADTPDASGPRRTGSVGPGSVRPGSAGAVLPEMPAPEGARPTRVPSGPVQVMALEVGPMRLAIATDRVRRIVPDEPASIVPMAPSGVVGIIDFEGEIVPVIDVRDRLGLTGARPEAGRLVVIGLETGPVALRVDATTDVGTIDGASVRAMPIVARSSHDDPVIGVVVLAGRLATLVDPEVLTRP